jgi:hypothetical protein
VVPVVVVVVVAVVVEVVVAVDYVVGVALIAESLVVSNIAKFEVLSVEVAESGVASVVIPAAFSRTFPSDLRRVEVYYFFSLKA